MISANKSVSLPDGRSLSYDECGDPDGAPVLVFHGSPASRIGMAGPEQDPIAERLGIRLIAPDRPGHGFSDHRPGRTILDWPVDVVGFADGLGLSRFSAVGVSGGSPYVAACAYRIPHRLVAAGSVSGIAPLDAPGVTSGMSRVNRVMFATGRWIPWLQERSVRKMGDAFATNPTTTLERVLAEVPEVDRAVLADPRRRQALIDSTREAFRRGHAGPALDLRLASRPWGFSLADVPMVMNLWFGLKDVNVPPAMGHYLAGAFARSEARVYPDEGHVSLYFQRFEEIMATLLATARREAGKPVG